MFWGLASGAVKTDFEFEHILRDIQTLNERATRGELDITAISIHAYAFVSGQYALLPSGASMGDGYGPLLVAQQVFSKAADLWLDAVSGLPEGGEHLVVVLLAEVGLKQHLHGDFAGFATG